MNKYITFINNSFNYFSLWYLIWFVFVYNNYFISSLCALQATGIHVSMTSIYFCWIKNTLPNKYIIFKTLCGDVLGHHVPLITILNINKNTNIYYYPFYYNIFGYLLISICSILITIIVSIYPAVKAAKLDPVKGLKYE